MKKMYRYGILLVLIFCVPVDRVFAATPIGLSLSESEKTWLDQHSKITLGVDRSWPPYGYFDENGVHRGLSTEIFTLIHEQLGLDVEMLRGLKWSEVMAGARDRYIDVVSLCTKTPERAEFLGFTEPMVEVPWVIVTREDEGKISDLGGLTGQRVAMVKGYDVVKMSREKYPEVIVIEVKSPAKGLAMVAQGEVSAFVDNMGVAAHYAASNNISGLKVAADAGLGALALRICYRSDWPELGVILDKALAAIPDDTMQQMQQHWIQSESLRLQQITE